jgi:hypothetical protein
VALQRAMVHHTSERVHLSHQNSGFNSLSKLVKEDKPWKTENVYV